jgi:hypothetical protein
MILTKKEKALILRCLEICRDSASSCPESLGDDVLKLMRSKSNPQTDPVWDSINKKLELVEVK